MKIISETLKIISETMPFDTEFIEAEIKKHNILLVRWAIVDVNKNVLTINVSGYVQS